MTWVFGFAVEGAAASPSTPYRGGTSRARRITIRNPPGLSMLGASVGFVFLAALGTFAVYAWMSDGPADLALGLRIPAAALGGLIVLGGCLSALTPHTRLWIDADRIVVERAKHGALPQVRLSEVQRFERDAFTASVRAITSDGPVTVAIGLLPEQADLLLAALRPGP